MARLQATIDESVGNILNLLKRRNDRARFIELAIKLAYSEENIRSQFSWKNSDNILQNAQNNDTFKKIKSKIEFDKDFD